jgi:hypothetical protein
MIHKFASIALVVALVCTIGGTSAFAGTAGNTDTPAKPLVTPPAPPALPKTEVQRDEKLRTSLARLVADTKAGKGTTTAAGQFHPSKGNNLSKNKKIAIGVAIAAVVVLAIVVIHAKNHFFDNFRLGN